MDGEERTGRGKGGKMKESKMEARLRKGGREETVGVKEGARGGKGR